MSTAPGLTVLQGGRARTHAPGGPGPPDNWNLDTVHAVEIIAPDHHCATLLLEHTKHAFPAEIIPGSSWTVRFHPPTSTTNWVTDLLELVEQWLQTTPLPCAKLHQGNRNYLIRAPQPSPLTPPAAAGPWEAA